MILNPFPKALVSYYTFNKVCNAIGFATARSAIAAGHSVIVLGEAGTGKTDFAVALHDEMSGAFQSAIATYKGSIKKFFIAIAILEK
ncbi:MAG: sigma 54-interacting transcriptional regulator [Waterburya sp.]